MNHRTTKTLLLESIRFLCILLFLYAATSKLLDFDTFQNQLGQSPLLAAYADAIVWLVPLSEIAIAVLLSIGSCKVAGHYAFFTLMVMFTAYIVIILHFTSHTPCSCGGVLEDLGWTEHLVFNAGFILLSGLSVMLLSQKWQGTLGRLLLAAAAGTVAIVVLFWGSERELRHNNAFVRKYLPHAAEKLGELTLESNSFYLAGADPENTYLGNYNAPLLLVCAGPGLKSVSRFKVAIDSMHLPYRRVRIAVKPPFFYVGDGSIPVLFKGRTDNWKARLVSYQDAYFTGFVPADSLSVGITTKSSISRSSALGLLTSTAGTVRLDLNERVVAARSKSNSFDSDGTLLWNDEHQCFLYTYFYSNRFEVLGRDLHHQATGTTIDTISRPIIDVAHYRKSQTYKLGARSVMVNRQSATSGHYLYIHSDRLGRYEDEEVLQSASIIDVYDLRDNSYAFSFYLYHQPSKKLGEFLVHGDRLVALVDDKLWIYHLKPHYFRKASDAQHTAQYQE